MVCLKLILLLLCINSAFSAELCILARAGVYKPTLTDYGPNLEDWGHSIIAFKNKDEKIIIQSAGSKKVAHGSLDSEKIIKSVISQHNGLKRSAAICYKLSPKELNKFYEYLEIDALNHSYEISEKLTTIIDDSGARVNSCSYTVEKVFQEVTNTNAPTRAFRTPVVSAISSPKSIVRNIKISNFASKLYKNKKSRKTIYRNAEDFYKFYTGEIFKE